MDCYNYPDYASCELYARNAQIAEKEAADIKESFEYGHVCGESAAYNHIYELVHDRISQLCEDDSDAAAVACSELCTLLEQVWNLYELSEDVKSDFFEIRHQPQMLDPFDPENEPYLKDPLPDLKPMQEWLESEDKWLEEQEAKLKDNGGH